MGFLWPKESNDKPMKYKFCYRINAGEVSENFDTGTITKDTLQDIKYGDSETQCHFINFKDLGCPEV